MPKFSNKKLNVFFSNKSFVVVVFFQYTKYLQNVSFTHTNTQQELNNHESFESLSSLNDYYQLFSFGKFLFSMSLSPKQKHP